VVNPALEYVSSDLTMEWWVDGDTNETRGEGKCLLAVDKVPEWMDPKRVVHRGTDFTNLVQARSCQALVVGRLIGKLGVCRGVRSYILTYRRMPGSDCEWILSFLKYSHV